MKKYKHKTTGVVVTQHFYKETKVYPEHYDYEYKRSETAAIHSSIDAMFVENSNDWEEVITSTNLNMQFIDTTVKEAPWIQQLGRGYRVKKEPNYLITAFRSIKEKDSIVTLQKDGTYGNGSIFTLKQMLKGICSVEDEKWEIYSVKNSKGEEFVLFDIVKFSHIKMPIIKFEILFDCMCIILSNQNRYELESVSKVKSQIYTTTDGIEIFEGDEITLTLIDKNNFARVHNGVYIKNFIKEEVEICNRYLTFTSEENRDKYIKENTKKPIFISADGKEMYEGDLTFSVLSRNTWEEKRIRVNNFITAMHKDWIHFRTKEARQEYIDNNKPKYSIFDIKSVLSEISFDNTRISEVIIEDLYKLKK